MCGLCGFGLQDAETLLELDEPTSMLLIDGDSSAPFQGSVTYDPMSDKNIAPGPAEKLADKRTVSALVAEALGVVWQRRCASKTTV